MIHFWNTYRYEWCFTWTMISLGIVLYHFRGNRRA